MTIITLIALTTAMVAWPTWLLLTVLARLAHLPQPDDDPRRFCERLLRQRGASAPVNVVYGGNSDRLAFGGRVMLLSRTTSIDAQRMVHLAVSCALADATRRLPSLIGAIDFARLWGLTCQVAGISLLVTAVVTGRPSADVLVLGFVLALATVMSVGVWAWDRYWARRVATLATGIGRPELGAWTRALADARAPGLAWYIVHAVLAVTSAVQRCRKGAFPHCGTPSIPNHVPGAGVGATTSSATRIADEVAASIPGPACADARVGPGRRARSASSACSNAHVGGS